MHSHNPPFQPADVFAATAPPQVLAAPSRYIQGDGVLLMLGRYLEPLGVRRAAVLISAGGRLRDGARLEAGLRAAGIAALYVTFGGECSQEEIARAVDEVRASDEHVDLLIAIGGGKCIDTGKCVAYRLAVPMVSCPSLASNDAPCSAVSVIYTAEGVSESLEFFPVNPALVVVDTRIVAEAPLRYLVAGMGDALATWYEARTCLANPAARTMLAARPTLAAVALGELCANTLFAHGEAAVEAVRMRSVTAALNSVVEANTLLSGVGFESGGLAAAHAVALGLTVLPQLHAEYLHGEMVAIGLMTQLALEQRADEAGKVAAFLATVGLPCHLGQLGLAADMDAELAAAMASAAQLPFLANQPTPTTPAMLVAAAREADHIGRRATARSGDAPWRRFHGG